MISLALSLALASSGFCNPLPYGNLELEARVGIEPTIHAAASILGTNTQKKSLIFKNSL